MRLSVATLGDAASIRDGLLSVISGGITRLVRDEYPAPILGAIGLIFVLDDEHDVNASVRINLVGPDGNSVDGIQDFETTLDGLPELYPATYSLALGVHQMQVPGPGRYAYLVFSNETQIGRIDFVAMTSEEAQDLEERAAERDST